MDANTVLGAIMATVSIAGFWFGVVKFVSSKLMGLDQKIETSHKELDQKIDDVKEKYVRHEYLDIHINKITETQKEVFAQYKAGQNLFLYGVAGTGKTFVALYNALKDVLDPKSPRERVYIVRSLLPIFSFYLP